MFEFNGFQLLNSDDNLDFHSNIVMIINPDLNFYIVMILQISTLK